MENKKQGMNAVCYYHNDSDGVVSAAIVKKFYKEKNFKIELIKCDYDKTPIIKCAPKYENIIIVDFSFEPVIMNELKSIYGDKLIWIDHHKTAMEKNIKIWKTANGLRSLNNSGCMLTWMYFFPNIEAPKIVKYVEDLDLWKWEFSEYSKPFNQIFYMRHKNPDDIVVEMLTDNNIINDYILEGNIVIEMQNSQIKNSYKNGKDIVWNGYKTRIINESKNISQLGEYCYKDKEHEIALIWYMKGNKVVVGLRSNQHAEEKINVGAIAKKYGGGGHMHASGFITVLEFIKEILK